MYIEQTKPHLMDSLLYCSLSIAPTCFNANTSSSGSSHLEPAKLHKRVHPVLVVFFLKTFTFVFRVVKILKPNCLSYNELYCRNNSRELSRVAVYTICVLMMLWRSGILLKKSQRKKITWKN